MRWLQTPFPRLNKALPTSKLPLKTKAIYKQWSEFLWMNEEDSAAGGVGMVQMQGMQPQSSLFLATFAFAT